LHDDDWETQDICPSQLASNSNTPCVRYRLDLIILQKRVKTFEAPSVAKRWGRFSPLNPTPIGTGRDSGVLGTLGTLSDVEAMLG
jgi:hypothetical protein